MHIEKATEFLKEKLGIDISPQALEDSGNYLVYSENITPEIFSELEKLKIELETKAKNYFVFNIKKLEKSPGYTQWDRANETIINPKYQTKTGYVVEPQIEEDNDFSSARGSKIFADILSKIALKNSEKKIPDNTHIIEYDIPDNTIIEHTGDLIVNAETIGKNVRFTIHNGNLKLKSSDIGDNLIIEIDYYKTRGLYNAPGDYEDAGVFITPYPGSKTTKIGYNAHINIPGDLQAKKAAFGDRLTMKVGGSAEIKSAGDNFDSTVAFDLMIDGGKKVIGDNAEIKIGRNLKIEDGSVGNNVNISVKGSAHIAGTKYGHSTRKAAGDNLKLKAFNNIKLGGDLNNCALNSGGDIDAPGVHVTGNYNITASNNISIGYYEGIGRVQAGMNVYYFQSISPSTWVTTTDGRIKYNMLLEDYNITQPERGRGF